MAEDAPQVIDRDPISGDPTNVAAPAKATTPVRPGLPDPYSVYQKRGEEIDTTAAEVKRLGEERRAKAFEPLPRTPPPNLQDIPAPQPAQMKSVFKEAMNPLIFLTAMGAGMMSKNHGMGAMKAATGFMEGFQEGDKARIELEQQNWKNNVQRITENNKNANDRYRAVLENNKLSAVERNAQLGAIAAEQQDTLTIDALRQGRTDMLFGLMKARETASAKLQAQNLRYGEAGNYSPEALDEMVGEYLAGNRMAIVGLSRSPVAQAQFRNKLAEKAKELGMSPAVIASKLAEFAGYSAAQRTLAVREVGIGLGAQELVNFAGPALEASERVPRGKWIPINKFQQDVKAMASNPDLVEFSNFNAALINAYSQVISRANVPTVHSQQRAEALLNTAQSQEAYQRGVDTLIREADLALKAPDMLRDRYRESFTGEKGSRSSLMPAPRAKTGQQAAPASSQPQVGEVRTNKNGVRAKWTGQGWEVIENAPAQQ